MNLRAQIEEFLEISLEDGDLFGLPINIIAPDGSISEYTGQVNYVSRDNEGFTINVPSVVLRLSSLSYIPVFEDKYAIQIPSTPSPTASMITYISNQPPKRNDSVGIITIYLTKVEQDK